MENMLIYLLLLIVAFLVGVFVARWVFGIDKILSHMKRQSYELAVLRRITGYMATNQQLSSQEIQNIADDIKTEFYR